MKHNKNIEKDQSILTVVKYLIDRFGEDSFKIRDNWDGDFCSIGLSDNTERYLIYISTYQKSKNRYYVSLENTTTHDDFPYDRGESFDDVDLKELERLFNIHLKIA